jgi:hypothetical protein
MGAGVAAGPHCPSSRRRRVARRLPLGGSGRGRRASLVPVPGGAGRSAKLAANSLRGLAPGVEPGRDPSAPAGRKRPRRRRVRFQPGPKPQPVPIGREPREAGLFPISRAQNRQAGSASAEAEKAEAFGPLPSASPRGTSPRSAAFRLRGRTQIRILRRESRAEARFPLPVRRGASPAANRSPDLRRGDSRLRPGVRGTLEPEGSFGTAGRLREIRPHIRLRLCWPGFFHRPAAGRRACSF